MPHGRSNSPTSVIQFPTMATPRQYWIINRNGSTAVIDLYATRNHWFDKYIKYQIPVSTHNQIQAFMDEMRFACEPNLRRWNAIRRPNAVTDPLMAEDWLLAHGQIHDLIDLTEVLTDIEEDPEAGSETFHESDSF